MTEELNPTERGKEQGLDVVAEDIGSVAAEGAASLEAQGGASPSGRLTEERIDKLEQERKFHQDVWEKRAAVRNGSRPTEGLFRKHPVGKEHSYMDIAHEEARQINQITDLGVPSLGRSESPQEKVDDMKRFGGGEKHRFFPGNHDWERGQWAHNQVARENNYWPDQEDIDKKTDVAAESILKNLEEGYWQAASETYAEVLNLLNSNRNREEYYSDLDIDYRTALELNKKIKPALLVALEKAFAENDAEAIGRMLKSPLASVITKGDIAAPEEQRRTPEIIEAAIKVEKDLIKLVAEFPVRIERGSRDYEYDYRGGFRGANLKKCLTRLVNLGIVDSYEEAVLIPELRQFAMDLAVGDYKEEESHSYFGPDADPMVVLRVAGLIGPGEFENHPEVIDIAEKNFLKEVTGVHLVGSAEDLGKYFEEQVKQIASKTGINVEEVLNSPEGQDALGAMFDAMAEKLEQLAKAAEDNPAESRAGLKMSRHYLSKIGVLRKLASSPDKEGESRLIIPEQARDRIDQSLEKLRGARLEYNDLQMKAAEGRIEGLREEKDTISDSIDEAKRDFGLAA